MGMWGNERMGAIFSASTCAGGYNAVPMDIASIQNNPKRCRLRKPKPFEIFSRALQPTPDECALMISDIFRRLGSWEMVEVVTGIPQASLCAWLWGRKDPASAPAKAIFLLWSSICRPGELQTTFDLSTCGRFTKRGNPATAGGKLKKNLRRYHGPQDDAGDME